MKSYCLMIGDNAGASLVSVLSLIASGAAGSVPSLDILHLGKSVDSAVLPRLTEDLNACRSMFLSAHTPGLFHTEYRYATCAPELPDLQALSSGSSDHALLSALRGRGIPLSYRSDREAVSWAFSTLLADRETPSLAPWFAWTDRIYSALSEDPDARVTLIVDPLNRQDCGLALTALRDLRSRFPDPSVFITLIAVPVMHPAQYDQERQDLNAFLSVLQSDSLLRRLEGEATCGADALWLLALPASLLSGADRTPVLALPVARILGELSVPGRVPSCGFHSRSLPGTVTWSMLGSETISVVSMLRAAVWFAVDVFPFLRSSPESGSPRRGGPSLVRNTLPKWLSRQASRVPGWTDSFAPLERCLRMILSQWISWIQLLPDMLVSAEENDRRWSAAVSACGKAVTTASEFDVSRREAEESGLDQVMPVHRVSMADTEEEKMQRRLDDMEAQLQEELQQRREAFRRVGGARAVQVLLDCRAKCVSAEETARARLKELINTPSVEHLILSAQERRCRLLKAAVLRCDRDLADAVEKEQWIRDPAEKLPVSASGHLLDGEFMQLLLKVLEGDAASERPLRDRLPEWIPFLHFSDDKTLQRTLMKNISSADGLMAAGLFAAFVSVSSEEVMLQQWLSAGSVPELPLLPDLYASDPLVTLSSVIGLLPSPADQQDIPFLRGLLAFLLLIQYRRSGSGDGRPDFTRLSAGDSPLLSAWLSSRHAESVWVVSLKKEEDDQPFALLLPGAALIPARLTEAHQSFIPFHVSWFNRESNRFMDPGPYLGETDRQILLAQLPRVADALPAGGDSAFLSSWLSAWIADLKAESGPASGTGSLDVRLRAVCGLLHMPAYMDSLRRIECAYERGLSGDRTASCLTGKSVPAFSVGAAENDILYSWRGVIFARENPKSLLSSLGLPEEDFALKTLEKECKTLSSVSDDYQDALLRNLLLFRDRFPDCDPEARRVLDRLIADAGEPLENKTVSFSWPWDPLSPSIRTIFRECLGKTLSAAAVTPFSDCLTVFPARGGEVLGDAFLNTLCVIPPRVTPPPAQDSVPDTAPDNPQSPTPETAPLPAQAPVSDPVPMPVPGVVPGMMPPPVPGAVPFPVPEPAAESVPASDAVLPPLHPRFASVLCLKPEGRTLLTRNCFSFTREENGDVRVVLALEGYFSMELTRTYTQEEIVSLYSHNMPVLALWPDLPFAPEDWHAYFLYSHTPSSLRVSALSADGGEKLLDTAEGRSVSCLSFCPVCLFLSWEGKTAGAVPNLLPRPTLPEGEAVTVCVDFGSTAASVVFSKPHGSAPMHGSSAVRMLLTNPSSSRDWLRSEFMPAVSVSALLPAVVRIFENTPGAAPVPFEEGILLMAAALEDVVHLPADSLFACMKWQDLRSRSLSLYLHQVMLLAALQARTEGAPSLSWRFAVPDEMAAEGRERWVQLLQSLVLSVQEESGFSAPANKPAVLFGSESQALGSYFRYCASEDTRGGFMVMDLGASTADISLFIRGREQAARTCQIPLGVHYMVLPSLLSDPDMLLRDFGFVTDQLFLHDCTVLREILLRAHADPAALRHARLALDTLVADHSGLLHAVIGQSLMVGAPGRFTSLLLLHCAFLMMLAGLILLQIAADPNKNDFLPEQMSLCLAGRGSRWIQNLPDPVRRSLWHFLTMFRNRRVASLSLLFSAEKKLEIPVGLSMLTELVESLPRNASVPASIAVRPEELLPEFLIRFRREFPGSAEQLFHGFFTNDFYHPFTPYGESMVSAAISQSFSVQQTPRPYDSLSAWIGTLLELIRENV